MVKGAGLKIRCVVLHGFKSHPRNHNTPTGFGGLGFAMFLPVFPPFFRRTFNRKCGETYQVG